MRKIFTGALFIFALTFTFACTKSINAETSTFHRSGDVREATFSGASLSIDTINGHHIITDIERVSVRVNNGLNGTFVEAECTSSIAYGCIYDIYGDVTVWVRTEAQAAEWNRRLAEVRDRYYKPRDVLPSPVSVAK